MLHADVVGSTRLVQQNETTAHARITDSFNRFSAVIQVYGGIVHEVRGDALVAEPQRASDAVTAAIAFQVASTQSNSEFDDGIVPEVRVGISLGEVVIADDTVIGPALCLPSVWSNWRWRGACASHPPSVRPSLIACLLPTTTWENSPRKASITRFGCTPLN
ncbi:MAG: adenylate/guanylate cyclase domain-containing protein [Chromatiales bacterium]|nr:adenylate/guanylate cyclase domain-containing protein [Chromatiales bacterium]